MSCKLNPITSLTTSRYYASTSDHLYPRVITRGPVSRNATSSSLNHEWQRFVHPEGQRYFLLPGQFAFNIVTDENVEDVQTEGRILDCVAVASKELYCHDIKVPPRCELFLELGDDRVSCNYYFVDHIGKSLFWLEDMCTDLLDIRPTASPSHLETQLERLYWVHVEFFPMHHGFHEQHFSPAIDDLYNVISHGQADRLTSNTSTFPYEAEQCTQFLKLLSKKKGQHIDGYTLCYAARLTGAIANQRFMTFYGQKAAQLDRLQEMVETDAVQHKWLFNIANLFMWGVPLHYTKLLDELYVNERVYAGQWSHFVSACLTDWTTSLSWSLPVFIASVLLANVRGSTITTSIPPALSSAVSIASASCLHLRHQPLVGSSASVGARYLYYAKSRTVGFLATSVAFSLPRASYLWGISLLVAQFFLVAFQGANRVIALTAASVVGGVMLFVLCVIHPEEGNLASLFRSLTSFCIPRMYASDAPEDVLMV